MRFCKDKDTGQIMTEADAQKKAPAGFYQRFALVTGQDAAIAEILHVIKTHEPADSYKYMLLDRLRTDCGYFLGNGNRDAGHLWAAGSVETHLECMRILWDSFPDEDKPEWLTRDDLERYAQDMAGVSLEEATGGKDRSYFAI